jgi:CheY-like chemotaxis protein
VDDDVPFRTMLAWCLSDLGYAVTEATDAGEALRLAGSRRFDAALVDYQLPDGTGQELLQELRRRKNDLTVVLMSANANDERRGRALAAGALEFLAKPVCTHALDRLLSGARSVAVSVEGGADDATALLSLVPATAREAIAQ